MSDSNKEMRQIRRQLSKFMDGAIKFKSPIIEALDRTMWRTFFYVLFTLLSKYITEGLIQEVEKILQWVKDENWTDFDSYVANLINKKIDLPYLDEESEYQVYVTAIQYLHSIIVLAKNKVIAISEQAEADDPILGDE